MSLILMTYAIGLLPAWRGSLSGVLLCAWVVAGVMAVSLLFGEASLAGLLPAIGLTILGFNIGVASGFGLHFAAGLRPAKIR